MSSPQQKSSFQNKRQEMLFQDQKGDKVSSPSKVPSKVVEKESPKHQKVPSSHKQILVMKY